KIWSIQQPRRRCCVSAVFHYLRELAISDAARRQASVAVGERSQLPTLTRSRSRPLGSFRSAGTRPPSPGLHRLVEPGQEDGMIKPTAMVTAAAVAFTPIAASAAETAVMGGAGGNTAEDDVRPVGGAAAQPRPATARRR